MYRIDTSACRGAQNDEQLVNRCPRYALPVTDSSNAKGGSKPARTPAGSSRLIEA